MAKHFLAVIAGLAASEISWAQVISYEASSGLFPEQTATGWYRNPHSYPSDRSLDNGWLVQYSQIVAGGAEESDPYENDFPQQAGLPSWFLQFRVITDTPPVYGDVGPATIAAGCNTGVLYHFVIGDSQIRFLRDVNLPYVYAGIQPGVPHTYRLEQRGTQSYSLWIDSVLIDSGSPEGQYPVSSSGISFRGKASAPVNTTKWDYIRFGKIATDRSGDFDSNGVVDSNDLYFFIDCLLGPDYDASGPGCRWADMNGDGNVDGSDIQQFITAMVGP